MSDRYVRPVSVYDNNNTYILTFKNNVKLSEFIGCSKVSIGKYLKSGKLFKGAYYFSNK